jgi:hypothetical protein
MPCCGQVVVLSQMHALPSGTNLQDPAARVTVNFQYTGKTGLTVVGSVTGMQYRFIGPGATLPVDARDQFGMMSVPKLRIVR